ncbi:hypothetical protein S83_012199, partial [Arachis hypogaea]
CKSAAPIFLLLFAFAFSSCAVQNSTVKNTIPYYSTRKKPSTLKNERENLKDQLDPRYSRKNQSEVKVETKPGINFHLEFLMKIPRPRLFHNFRKEVNDGLRIGLEMRIAQLESEKSSLLQKEVRLVEETKRDDEADIKREAGSQEGTQQVAGTNENAADGSNPQTKKLIISDEYFQRVTRALIMHLRQHEETVLQQGSGKGTVYLSIKNWVGWNKATRFDSMVDQQNEKNAYSSMEEVKAELSRLKAIIESLIQRKGYLIVLDDGMHEAAEGAAPEH